MPYLTEREWGNLLRDIKLGNVVPVVGPELATVTTPEVPTPLALHRLLAPQLARALGLEEPERYQSYNDVGRAFLFTGANRQDLYYALGDLMDSHAFEPPQALLDLAAIQPFNLFLASSPDPLLALAVQRQRPGFDPERQVLRFHPSSAGSTSDLPTGATGPWVYHILGDTRTVPDFALWEEDYMEYICGLIERRDILPNLFRELGKRSLLLLGAPSEDWIVRFFLRAARGERLSARGGAASAGYLVGERSQLGEPLVFFFDKAVRATRVVEGTPQGFVEELASRWSAFAGSAPSDPTEFLRRLPDRPPRGCVFISYANEDLSKAAKVAQALSGAGIPVWLDKQRLVAGGDYNRALEGAIKQDCSFFISLISAATEGNPDRYVHRERRWAAERHVEGRIFYVPLIVDATLPPLALEPAVFAGIHCERLENLGAFVSTLSNLHRRWQAGGQPTV